MHVTSSTARSRFRAAGAAACAAAALGGVIAYTRLTSYPFPPRAAPAAFVIAVIYLAGFTVLSAVSAAALRSTGRSWASALSADALTYAPLALLWVVILQPGLQRLATPLWWSAVTAVGVAKATLLAPLARLRMLNFAAAACAQGVPAIASRMSVLGRAIAPFALIALAARWRLLHLYDGLATPEQGLLAHAAYVILSGKAIYRDLSSVFPPGALYLHAAAFAALGSTLVAGNVALAAGAVLLPLAVYGVCERMMPAGMAFAAALVVALTGEGGLALFLVLCGVGVAFARSGSRGANWCLVGVLTALAAAFDLVLGLAAAGALAVMLYLRQRGFVMRRVGAAGVDLALGVGALTPFAGGVAIVWAPLLAYFSSHGTLRPLGADLLAGVEGRVFAVLRPEPSAHAVWSLAAIYVAGMGLLLWRLVNRRLGEAEFAALTVIGWGAMVWGWFWHSGDAYHLALSVPAAMMTALLLFGWAAKALGQSLVAWPPWDHLRAVRAWVAALVVMGVCAGFIVLWGARAVVNLAEIAGVRLTAAARSWYPLELLAASGAYVPPREARDLKAVVDYVQLRSAPDEPVFCIPGRPDFYLLADRPNPTRLDYLYEGQAAAGDLAQAVAELERGNVRLVVTAPPAARWQWKLKPDPLVARYVARHYEQVAEFGGYAILLRRGASTTPRVTPSPVPPPPSPPPPASAPSPTMFGPKRR